MIQINSRYTTVGTKEIKKVAEARARKKKRAMGKLKAAKRQATALAENADLSEKQKLKAISKAMRGSKAVDKPSKVYVVTHKTSAGSVATSTGGKGRMKFVDSRMKKEMRAERARKRRGKK